MLSEEFTIAGVFRTLSDDEQPDVRWYLDDSVSENADLILPAKTAQDLAVQIPRFEDWGFHVAIVLVDDEANVKTVTEEVEQMGLHHHSLVRIIERVQRHASLVTYSMAMLGAIALFVSAIGITNTMVMSVLERTREIGVMKAVGGRDSHILLMFLVEGTLLGLARRGVGAAGSTPGRVAGQQHGHSVAPTRIWPIRGRVAFCVPAVALPGCAAV